ncbi:MAG: restriction endonuclease [Lysinibacillus sp.]
MAKKRRTKKRAKRRLPIFTFIFAALFGYAGWNVFETTEGIVGGIILFFCLWTLWKLRKSIRKRNRLRRAGIYDIDKMTGEEFEKYLSILFKRRGYRVSLTAKSGDYGCDLLLKDGSDVIAVQAKRYSGSVGVKAVQEIIGAIRMYDATEAWVVTNSYYTKQAIKLANMNDVYLIDRNDLIELILDK